MKMLLSVMIAIFLLVPQSTQTGVVYTARMEKLGKTSTFTVWVSGTRAKFSVSGGDDPRMPAGISIIAVNAGEQYVLISREKEEYVELSRDQYRTLLARQAAAQGVNIESSKREEVVVDGDGGLVAGYRTRYYKLRFSVNAVINGQNEIVTATEEFWTAPSIPDPAPSLDMLTQQVSGVDQLDAVLDYKKFKGMPLKRVVQLSENSKPAGTSLVEITKIWRATVADSMFDAPSNYKKLNIPGPPAQHH